MKILLIMPDAGINRLELGSFRLSLREAPLTLTTLAALVPAELGADIHIVDESVDVVPLARPFDIVGISCITGTAPRAYTLADHFRKRGSVVILGGIHVSLRPDEAVQHADSIVVGFAEKTWPQLLTDYRNKRLRKVYRSDSNSLSGLPTPRRDLQKRFGYTMPNTVSATRGCHGRCSFCSVPAVQLGWQIRPVGEVVEEIRQLPRRRFVFNDVNLMVDREYAKELFTALIPLNRKWGGLAPISLAKDQELLDIMSASGCQYLLIGFESVHQASLTDSIYKETNRVADYAADIRTIHDHGIVIQGCFIFGMDEDDKTIFSNTVDAVNTLRIDIPRYAILTPYPGTPVYRMLKSQNRILHENWQYYDTRHVVYVPGKMSPEDLYAGYRWAYKKSFSMSSLPGRVLRSRHPIITLLGNLAYRIQTRRLNREPKSQLHTIESQSYLQGRGYSR